MSYKITERQQFALDELKAFHFEESPSIDWQKETSEPFSKNTAGPNEKVWIDKKRNFETKLLSKIAGVNQLFHAYYSFKQNKGTKADQLLYQKWEENYPFAKSMIKGELDSWRLAVRRYANFRHNCDVAKAYKLHLYDEETVECDVYLHALEEVIPIRVEKVTERGKIRFHNMPKTNRLELYETYVYSCLNKIVNDLFAVLPCDIIFINGVLELDASPQPIFSAVIDRKHHQQKRCPKRTIVQHNRHFVTFKKRSGFYPLKRVFSPQGLFREG
ncbi:hypothetical protein EU245_07410 [Lentibacillus lipolyticus]|nr:hypothetical protein EU245_07410 [Lentibacillus lipolyticus]